MKNKFRSILALLIATPMLMANSPVPQVTPDPYKDFSYSYLSKTQTGDDYQGRPYYSYKFDVTNSGEGYIDSINIKLDSTVSSYRCYRFYDDRFGSLLLSPGKSAVYQFVTLENVNVIPANVAATATAYVKFVDNAIKEYNEPYIKDDGYGYKSLRFDYKLNNIYEEGYLYEMIINFDYDGVNYSINRRIIANIGDETEYLDIYRDQEDQFDLDISKFSINKVLVTKGEYTRYTYFGDVLRGIGIVLLVCLGILASGGIFCLIFFSIRRARRNKRLAS